MSIPSIKATETIETKHPDGRVDVNVKVPLLKLAGVAKGGFEAAKKILVEQFGLSPEDAEQKLNAALKREADTAKGV